MFKKFFVLIMTSTVAMGCANTPPKPTIMQTSFAFELVIDSSVSSQHSTLGVTYGRAEYAPGYCRITLREYPTCLLHEIRHCIEGDFHPNIDSVEDC